MQDLLRLGERQIPLRRACGGRGGINQRHRVVDEYAGRDQRLANALHLAAVGILHAGPHAGGLHGGAVRPAGMAIDARQPHRAIGNHGIQIGRGGETSESPFFLVPAPAQNPWPCGIFAREGGDLVQCFLERIGVAEI